VFGVLVIALVAWLIRYKMQKQNKNQAPPVAPAGAANEAAESKSPQVAMYAQKTDGFVTVNQVPAPQQPVYTTPANAPAMPQQQQQEQPYAPPQGNGFVAPPQAYQNSQPQPLYSTELQGSQTHLLHQLQPQLQPQPQPNPQAQLQFQQHPQPQPQQGWNGAELPSTTGVEIAGQQRYELR
jgi:hypothetical protein